LRDQVTGQFTQQRLIARLTSFFGILSLVLASIGLYGVTADLQAEYCHAVQHGRVWRSRWVRIAGYTAALKVIALCGWEQVMRIPEGWTARNGTLSPFVAAWMPNMFVGVSVAVSSVFHRSSTTPPV
jgi:hypothetical protein